ncbi:hypothetical protein NQ318_007493 [Aromia moschata]|uniref:Uncharacterized protein n=1 Tax=Aromia moschata TaxID=1265417 RepID=A0AAV8YE04_9CUCU|nr:hypothetical protein NQ318_007493 [Aromia moschata]
MAKFHIIVFVVFVRTPQSSTVALRLFKLEMLQWNWTYSFGIGITCLFRVSITNYWMYLFQLRWHRQRDNGSAAPCHMFSFAISAVPGTSGARIGNRHVYKTKKCCQEEVVKLWNTAKQTFPKKEDLVKHVQHEINQLLREAAERKARNTLAFLSKGNTRTSDNVSTQVETSAQDVSNLECASQTEISVQIVQREESAAQNEITHTNQQLRDQDYENEPQPAATMRMKLHQLPHHPLYVLLQLKMLSKKEIDKRRMELDLTERRKRSLVADGTEQEKVHDKARVPIGLTAANKQAPLLMHIEYKVSLPDHDFTIAARHKLIRSVYALCEVKPNEMGRPEAVSYSGPTYIAIRSGKHSSSTATSHAQDLDTLLTLEPFLKFMKNGDGRVKRVLIISSDGGPDENPRYRKRRDAAIHVVSILHPPQKSQNIDVRPIMHELYKYAKCDPRGLSQDVTELLCASDNGLEWLNQSEVEGADDFIENHLDMLWGRPHLRCALGPPPASPYPKAGTGVVPKVMQKLRISVLESILPKGNCSISANCYRRDPSVVASAAPSQVVSAGLPSGTCPNTAVGRLGARINNVSGLISFPRHRVPHRNPRRGRTSQIHHSGDTTTLHNFSIACSVPTWQGTHINHQQLSVGADTHSRVPLTISPLRAKTILCFMERVITGDETWVFEYDKEINYFLEPECLDQEAIEEETLDVSHDFEVKEKNCLQSLNESTTFSKNSQKQFLANERNNKNFIEILKKHLINHGFEVRQAWEDADIMDIRKFFEKLTSSPSSLPVIQPATLEENNSSENQSEPQPGTSNAQNIQAKSTEHHVNPFNDATDASDLGQLVENPSQSNLKNFPQSPKCAEEYEICKKAMIAIHAIKRKTTPHWKHTNRANKVPPEINRTIREH